MLIWIGYERGYEKWRGWAAHKFKDRFGTFPAWGSSPEPLGRHPRFGHGSAAVTSPTPRGGGRHEPVQDRDHPAPAAGDLQKLLRSRYGPTLPNDDAGREDLRELLLPVWLGLEAKMPKAIEVWAPWMSADEGTQLIDQINRIPLYERKVRARRLGERLHVTNREREALKLQTIAPGA